MRAFGVGILMLFTLLACSGGPSNRVMPSGGTVGNGGDDGFSVKRAAWFPGRTSLTYCALHSPEFGADLLEALSALDRAAALWENYLRDRAINEVSAHPELAGLKVENHLHLNLLRHRECDGTEDLTVLLGVDAPEVVAERDKLDSPVALVARRRFVFPSERRRAFLWISAAGKLGRGFPNWKRPTALEGTFLHELGHFLGNDHIDGTIMDEAISRVWLRRLEDESLPFSERRLDRIDLSRALVVNLAREKRTEIRKIRKFFKPFSLGASVAIDLQGKAFSLLQGIGISGPSAKSVVVRNLRRVGEGHEFTAFHRIVGAGSPVEISIRSGATDYFGTALFDGGTEGTPVFVRINGRDAFMSIEVLTDTGRWSILKTW